jgi:XTP/dITP diphosphohydrolase
MELVLATRNAHKLAEVGRMLAPFQITVAPLPAEVILPPEVGDSYAANALPKARTAALALGHPAIADDSGVEAAALGGRPGVRSARFAGEKATDAENLERLLAEVPAGSELRYVCALAFVDGSQERVFIGQCRGVLAAGPRGGRGFGYDPVFLPAHAPGRTMAELADAEKDQISHRGEALREFANWYRAERGDR